MSSTIQCDIVCAQEMIFSGDAAMLIATGVAGELGITPRHAPLMTTLKPGPVRVLLPDGEESIFFVGGGILEVMPHLVTVLADTAVRADDLDEAAAIAEAQAKLVEAITQLEALERWRKRATINR